MEVTCYGVILIYTAQGQAIQLCPVNQYCSCITGLYITASSSTIRSSQIESIVIQFPMMLNSLHNLDIEKTRAGGGSLVWDHSVVPKITPVT